jgi:hypothetical protein
MAGYDHDDPALSTGAGGLTVWKLQQMAQEKRFDELDQLFHDGLTMNALPVGYGAGAAARVAAVNQKIVADALDSLAGASWRGKIFFSSNDKSVSKGRNRIRKSLLVPDTPIVPMARFETFLVDGDPLTPRVRSNLVVLNYADPETRPYWQEIALTRAPVYDVMVATRGQWGPVFVGKTWVGEYDAHGRFTASDPDELICWYFLDFNAGALAEQRDRHSDDSEEEMLDPLPHVDN